jgi:uncharacterized Zn finger protein
VSTLAVTEKGGLIAWVEGSERYATWVQVNDEGLLESFCTCPYEIGCKHGVAMVFEYLERLDKKQRVPKAKKDDERLALFEDNDWDDEIDDDEDTLPEALDGEVEAFLKGRTKAQLIELIRELAQSNQKIAGELSDRLPVIAGNTKAVVARIRREIREIGDEPDWDDHWRNDVHIPDYSRIRTKLKALLDAGNADEVLALGEELIRTGTRQVEEIHDEGETAMEIADCMPVVVKALNQSSMSARDRLAWAMETVLMDQYELCEAFAEYLHRQHSKAAWHALGDHLLKRLSTLKNSSGDDDINRSYGRDQRRRALDPGRDSGNRGKVARDRFRPAHQTKSHLLSSKEMAYRGGHVC